MGWKLVWNLLLFALVFHLFARRKVLAGKPYTVYAVWRNAYGKSSVSLACEPNKPLKLNVWATGAFLAAHGMTGAPLWKFARVAVTLAGWLFGSLLAVLVGVGALRHQPAHFAVFDMMLYAAFLCFLLLDMLLGSLQVMLERAAGIPFTARNRLANWLQLNPLAPTVDVEKPEDLFAKRVEREFGHNLKQVPWWFTPGNPLVRWPAWIRALASPLAGVFAIMAYGLLEGAHFTFSDAGDVVVCGLFLVLTWVAPLERALLAAPWAGYSDTKSAFAVSWLLEDFDAFPD